MGEPLRGGFNTVILVIVTVFGARRYLARQDAQPAGSAPADRGLPGRSVSGRQHMLITNCLTVAGQPRIRTGVPSMGHPSRRPAQPIGQPSPFDGKLT